jgi:hypothetical protein
MRELTADTSVATLTVADLEEMITEIMERREVEKQKKQSTLLKAKRARLDQTIESLQADGMGGRLLERLLAARAEDSEREQ